MTNNTSAIGMSTNSTDMKDGALKKMEEDQKKFSEEDSDDDFEEGEFNTAVAKLGEGVHWDQEDTEQKHGSQLSFIHSQMMSYKQNGSYGLGEDVYAFITVAPVFSMPFVFACGVIGIKYIVYGALLYGVIVEDFEGFDGAEKAATAVKFFLIPVAVAMQEDLMAVYAGVANARYDSKVLEISEHATKFKFGLSYLLRLFDGLFSLTVNFSVMLKTDDVLGVFLNFAALHFLQDIDDVFYALVEKGFFGDGMEHMSTVCRQISWPRRTGSNRVSKFLTNLDTILFTTTLLICLVVYIVVTCHYVVFVEETSVEV